MDGHLVPASSNSKILCSLENFTLDAERWLAALYWVHLEHDRRKADPELWRDTGQDSPLRGDL